MDHQHLSDHQENTQQVTGNKKDIYHGSYHGGGIQSHEEPSEYEKEHLFDVYQSKEDPVTPGSAIGSLILGIVSIPLCFCCGIGIFAAVISLIMAIISFKEYQCGVGIAGLVCSIVGICFNTIALIFFLWAGAFYSFQFFG